MRGSVFALVVAVLSACEFRHAGVGSNAAEPDALVTTTPTDAAPADTTPRPPDASPPDADPCPPSYVSTPFGCFRMVGDEETFVDAELACQNDGGHLAVLGDPDENAFVTTLIAGRSVWIGLSDRASEGTFLWVTDAALAFDEWATGEPNNLWGEDCTEYRADETWNDVWCDSRRPYVCEIDGVPPGTSWQ
jgi:hypothetical protein